MPCDSVSPYLMTYARDISFYPILKFQMKVTYPKDARDFFLIEFPPSPNKISRDRLARLFFVMMDRDDIPHKCASSRSLGAWGEAMRGRFASVMCTLPQRCARRA